MSGFQNDETYLANQFNIPSTPQAEAEEIVVPNPAAADEQVRRGVVDIDVFFTQDVSGSMADQRGPVADGMNEIVHDLQGLYPVGHPFTTRLSITTFSSYDNIRIGELKPIQDIQPICAADFICDGSTAMRDAVARVISKAGEESGDRTIVLKVFTDGQDNDSRIGSITLGQAIEEFKKGHSNRSVLFIGSDPMAFHTAGGIGLTRHQSIKHTLDDTPSAYSACAHAIARCASGETPSAEFNDDDILLSEGGRRHEVFPGGTDEVVNSYDIVDMMDDNVPTVRRGSGY
jgi:hypothetical protein